MNSVTERVVDIVRQRAGGRDVSEETDIFGSEIVDSFSILELISGVENEFKIEFEQEELVPQNFSSPRAISILVQSKIVAN